MERNMEYIYISRWCGDEIEIEGRKHVWIGDTFKGTGIAAATQKCAIQLPLSTKPLQHFLQVLKSVNETQLLSVCFTMAGTVIALHYQTFIEKLRSFPITLAYGESGTGKTSALHCGLGLVGADNLRFFRDLLPAKVSQLCLVASIPLGVDDPDSKNSFSKIIMDLFNGAKWGILSDQPLMSDLGPWRALYSLFVLAFKIQLMTCTDPCESDKRVRSFVWSHEFTHFFFFGFYA